VAASFIGEGNLRKPPTCCKSNNVVSSAPTTCATSAYHHKSCEFEPQLPVTGQWFSLGTTVSPTKKTDRHTITEILLKVALNTINNQPI
jgi:hypothetical protein